MRAPIMKVVAIATLISLTGCTSPPPEPRNSFEPSTAPLTTVPTAAPAPTAAETYADLSATSDVLSMLFDFGGYLSTADSGYAYPGETADAFPRGTHVVAVRITLMGRDPAGPVDVSGLSFAASNWEGRPDLAVLDQVEGPAFAESAGLPWGVGGALGAEPWLLPTDQKYSFLLAFFKPELATSLNVVIDIPSQTAPLTLHLPLGGE